MKFIFNIWLWFKKAFLSIINCGVCRNARCERVKVDVSDFRRIIDEVDPLLVDYAIKEGKDEI